MVEKYAMLSNVKSLELASKEIEEKVERIKALEEEIEYFNKIKAEKEKEIKDRLKKINEEIKLLTERFSEKKK